MFTSAPAATFPQSYYTSFSITTSGNPIPTITQTGKLPGGVKFTDNGDGTATLSGRPGNGQGLVGDYALVLTASNGINPPATQNFTLTVSSPPRIVSANNATFVVGTSNSFTVKALKTVPKSTLSVTGTLPAGVTFTAHNNGTATLSGTPAAGSEGTYQITLTAQNGTVPNATQLFTLTVQEAVPISRAPTITSAASVTFAAGIEGTFTVRTSGLPTAILRLTGTLPEWLTFIDNTDGTATIVGAPDLGGAASYGFTITATNGVLPDAVQAFTVFVLYPPPTITSVDNATFVVGTSNFFTVKTMATSPTSLVSFSGTLPSGVTFVPNPNGTATLSGTPPGGSEGTYPLIITAANGTLPDAIQNFSLIVQASPPVLQAPAITSATTSTFTVGSPGTFAVTTTGTPTAQVTLIGPRPSWLSYVDHTDGTATFSGTPDSESDDTYSFTITAANGVLPNATQTFTLSVTQAPTITTPANATFAVGTPGSFIVETRGNPVASLSKTGTLPTGVSFLDNGDGTARIAGTPAVGTLELRQDGSMIASNDDWQDAPNTADIPDGFEPTDPREAVIVTTLQPGAYTVIEAGKDNATGLGLVEVYDLDSAGDAILANISTRGFVETGNEVMIGGFILGGGTGGSTVVVRAIGPSLTPFGIGNALANPTLELHDENGALILNNDDWQDDPVQAAQITAAGFAPQNDLESAIIMLLSPRPYSAIVAGKDGGTGVALVEVYNLP